MWNSTLNERFFSLLGRKIIWDIILINCQIGNSIHRCLEINRLRFTLSQLDIRTDPISNYGLKMLIKIDFKYFETLEIQNTNLTNDGLNMLNKGNTKL